MLAPLLRALCAVGVSAARPCAVCPATFGLVKEDLLEPLPLSFGQRGAMRADAIGTMFADAPCQEMVIAHLIHSVVHQQRGRFVAWFGTGAV